MQIRMQLSTTRKNDLSTIEYFNRMKSLADQMASIGYLMSNDDLIGYIMAGLDGEYNPLASFVMNRSESIGLSKFYNYFFSYETRLEQQNHAL